jgi:hypothetical protein
MGWFIQGEVECRAPRYIPCTMHGMTEAETPRTSRPRQVETAVRLIVLSILVGIAADFIGLRATLATPGSFFLVRVVLAAWWALLAVSIHQGRRWARVLFVVFTILSLPPIATAPAQWPTTLPYAIEALLRFGALACLFGGRSAAFFRPAVAPPPRPPVSPAAFVAVLVVQTGLIAAATYSIAKSDVTGSWDFLLVIPVFSISIALAIVYCFSRSANATKIIVVLVTVATPIIARALVPMARPVVAYRLNPKVKPRSVPFTEYWRTEWKQWDVREAADARAAAELENRLNQNEEMKRLQLEELQSLFASPQSVRAAGHRFIILDNDQCVVMHGIEDRWEHRDVFKTYAQEHLVGKTVEIRVPPRLTRSYTPGPYGRSLSGSTYGQPRDRQGHVFGDIEGLVFLDGHLVNGDFARPDHVKTLAAYQRAYDRGEL